MPEYLPTPVQPIIPGSKYYGESPRSYYEPRMGISGTVGDMSNIKDVLGSEALILALNKLLRTAPARAVRGNPDITANNPSDAAFEQAIQIMEGAKIPANTSQVDKVSALTKYMQQLGIPLQ